ncbi:TetR family transcriptional regulator [Streptomyces xylophagus]|uniref:TetR family transcriptional regulator n=1 Tax=Streptomyces xylophagus TaxID=285514 RepID=UPI001F3B2416|nr:TetR family transcriptional regulator [Streptomyces xylophagus]
MDQKKTDGKEGSAPRRPRRSPRPEDRVLDAERSRRQLLEAALDVFSLKGFDGARVQEIADRAGVNKQLISYYFGGKLGLYRELQKAWQERESSLGGPDLPLDEAVVRHLQEALRDPRPMRLGLWRGLTNPSELSADEPEEREDLSHTYARRDRRELAEDIDPASAVLLLIGAVAAPVTMPQLVRRIFGMEASDPAFQEQYADQLRRMIRRLALPLPDEPSPEPGSTGHRGGVEES